MLQKTLLIIALFVGLGNVNAQDASIDATWNETIAFIEKYQHQFKNGNCSGDALKNSTIENNIWTFETCSGLYQILLLDLKEVQLYTVDNWSYSLLLFSTPAVTRGLNSSSEDKVNFFNAGIFDSELQMRMFNAFRHLAKLATEKREAERKASGDKF